jgi:hypothetical protein
MQSVASEVLMQQIPLLIELNRVIFTFDRIYNKRLCRLLGSIRYSSRGIHD